MLPIITIVLLVIHISVAQKENNWDLAVTSNDQILILTSNGTLLDASVSFSRAKALTFDNIHNQFVVSYMNGDVDAIYSMSFKENNNTMFPIEENLPDDVQSLAIDSSTNILYWTDPKYMSINYVSLNKAIKKSQTFINLIEQEPQHLVIHSCKRYLYFTNSLYTKPSIDRVNLDTKEHTVLINSDLRTPVGITIDYVSNKLYWSDWGPGIYFRIESANLEGEKREIVISDTYQQPFGLAVDYKFIYWTDVNNNILWKAQKENNAKIRMYQLMRFEERSYGMVSRYLGFVGSLNCENIIKLKDKYNEMVTKYSNEKNLGHTRHLNNQEGIGHDNYPREHIGRLCNTSSCVTYCLHGKYNLTGSTAPECHCYEGYFGIRCENSICDNFCLNIDICNKPSNHWNKCFSRNEILRDECEIDVNNICNKN